MFMSSKSKRSEPFSPLISIEFPFWWPTASREAYEAYLAGQLAWPRRTREALEDALVHFGNAVRLDPDFALAHVGLANSYLLAADYAGFSSGVARTSARNAIENAGLD